MKKILLLLPFCFNLAFALTNDEATALVSQSLQNTEVASSKSYCTKGTMTCRTMYRLKDKTTGKLSNVFYDTFYSADRQVGSTCYFIPSEKNSNKYYVLTDSTFDGKLGINIISPLYANIKVLDQGSRIIYANLKSPKLGTTQYSLSSFDQSENVVVLKGTLFDNENPDFKQDIKVEYFRINP